MIGQIVWFIVRDGYGGDFSFSLGLQLTPQGLDQVDPS
jgi:hypothetical protein